MFANRYTALIDACVLADVLRRNLLLTLADAGFFRVRWSEAILSETARAIARMAAAKGLADPEERGTRACDAMARAFPEADGGDRTPFLNVAVSLPDPGDMHLVAAALKTQAKAIVTENLRHFPSAALATVGLEARNADDFIADTIALDRGRAIPAIRAMRLRLQRPAIDADRLIRDMEARRLIATADMLAPYVASL
jgi:predicted nucleic acid-binding protein